MNVPAWLSAFVAGGLLSLAAALPASAAILQFTATLDGPSESPPVASMGTGTAAFTFDTDDPAMPTMRVQTSFSGLTGTTTVAHIHCCTAIPGAGNVGVATPVPTFPGFPAGVMAGSYDALFVMSLAASYNPAFITANGGTPLSAFAALLTGVEQGRAYLNIHSTFATGGEIRGFLQAVPEPQTYALLAVGLGMLGWVSRRQRRQARG